MKIITQRNSYHSVKWDDCSGHDEVKDIVQVLSEQEIFGVHVRPHLKQSDDTESHIQSCK